MVIKVTQLITYNDLLLCIKSCDLVVTTASNVRRGFLCEN